MEAVFPRHSEITKHPNKSKTKHHLTETPDLCLYVSDECESVVCVCVSVIPQVQVHQRLHRSCWRGAGCGMPGISHHRWPVSPWTPGSLSTASRDPF